MALEQFTNNATTTLNGAINNSVTSVVVASASGFPASGNFRIIIDDEIMLVTAVSGTTFTATRGVEGTTASSHSDATAVAHILTAGGLDRFRADNVILDAYASIPAASKEGRLFLPTDSGAEIAFRDTGAAWKAFGPIHQLVSPPAVGSWDAQVNIDTIADYPGSVAIRETSSGSGDNLRGLFNNAPGSTPYLVDVAMIPPIYSGGGYMKVGCAFRESGTSKLIILYAGGGLASTGTYIDKYSSETSFSGNYVGNQNTPSPGLIWFRLENNGTNLKFYVSSDGDYWQLVASHTLADFFTTGPDQVGLISGVFGGTSGNQLQAKFVHWYVH